MIKTIIKENTGQRRRLSFIEHSGRNIKAGAVMVLDGCYPDACLTEVAKQAFMNEIKYGGILLAYASDVRMYPSSVLTNPETVFMPPVEESPEEVKPTEPAEAQEKAREKILVPDKQKADKALENIRRMAREREEKKKQQLLTEQETFVPAPEPPVKKEPVLEAVTESITATDLTDTDDDPIKQVGKIKEAARSKKKPAAKRKPRTRSKKSTAKA